MNDSSGKPRPDTAGGATRKLFMQLPGVGAKTAKIWFDLGYRCAKSVCPAVQVTDLICAQLVHLCVPSRLDWQVDRSVC